MILAVYMQVAWSKTETESAKDTVEWSGVGDGAVASKTSERLIKFTTRAQSSDAWLSSSPGAMCFITPFSVSFSHERMRSTKLKTRQR